MQPKRSDIEDNGKAYLKEVESRFEQALKNLPEQHVESIDGLSEENAYLHIQGHQLYKLVLHIGVCCAKGWE